MLVSEDSASINASIDDKNSVLRIIPLSRARPLLPYPAPTELATSRGQRPQRRLVGRRCIQRTSRNETTSYMRRVWTHIPHTSTLSWCFREQILLLVVPFRQFLYGLVPAFTHVGSGLYLKLDRYDPPINI